MTDTSPIIHVVDDDPSFRAAIAELLNACGYQVALHSSAMQLLEAPLGSEPACILLDVQMPDVDGPQLQARLAWLGHRLPIIFLTGHGDIPMSVQAIKAGAEDFLTKPVRKEALLPAIERALAHGERMRAGTSGDRHAFARCLAHAPRGGMYLTCCSQGTSRSLMRWGQRNVSKMHRHNLMQKCPFSHLRTYGDCRTAWHASGTTRYPATAALIATAHPPRWQNLHMCSTQDLPNLTWFAASKSR